MEDLEDSSTLRSHIGRDTSRPWDEDSIGAYTIPQDPHLINDLESQFASSLCSNISLTMYTDQC